MREEVGQVLYEIRHGIFPPPFRVNLSEYYIIEKEVRKHKEKEVELLSKYLARWVNYIKAE